MEAERCLSLAAEHIEQLMHCSKTLNQMRVPNDVFKSIERFQQLHAAIQQQLVSGTVRRNGDEGRFFKDAMAWINQQKRLIETASWGDDASSIEKQIMAHKKFHNTIQRSVEVERAREEMLRGDDRYHLSRMESEWDTLQVEPYSLMKRFRFATDSSLVRD
ncbi:desmoplakin-A-like [Xenentodon cancila]